MLDEDRYCDQYIYDQHFQNNFSELLTNQFFQSNINSCDHSDLHFHSEQYEESSSGFLHYEGDSDSSVLPNDVN